MLKIDIVSSGNVLIEEAVGVTCGEIIGLYIRTTNEEMYLPTETADAIHRGNMIAYVEQHGGFPVRVSLPCENQLVFANQKEIESLEFKDIPCPCGDPTHWLMKVGE